MIRLTVLYNLPEGADQAEFIKWRLTEHQASNESISGVLSTDFARIGSNCVLKTRGTGAGENER